MRKSPVTIRSYSLPPRSASIPPPGRSVSLCFMRSLWPKVTSSQGYRAIWASSAGWSQVLVPSCVYHPESAPSHSITRNFLLNPRISNKFLTLNRPSLDLMLIATSLEVRDFFLNKPSFIRDLTCSRKTFLIMIGNWQNRENGCWQDRENSFISSHLKSGLRLSHVVDYVQDWMLSFDKFLSLWPSLTGASKSGVFTLATKGFIRENNFGKNSISVEWSSFSMKVERR